jgi:hypothetical protein
LQLIDLSLYKSGCVIGKRSQRKPTIPATNATLTIPETNSEKEKTKVSFNKRRFEKRKK